jgi:hypothetical protein
MRLYVSFFIYFFCICARAADCSLFETIKLTGDPSAAFAEDLDDDGCDELFFITAQIDGDLLLNIKSSGTKSDLQKIKIGRFPVEEMHYAHVRDSSSNVVVVKDFDSDGLKDIGTAYGVIRNTGNNIFTFIPFKTEEKYMSLLPVVSFPPNSSKATRILPSGDVEVCSINSCEKWFNVGSPLYSDSGELQTGDFDHDGIEDLIIGIASFGVYGVFSRDEYASLRLISEMDLHSVDFEVLDLNRDGFLDIIAQREEFISDFPSTTSIFLSSKDGFKLSSSAKNFTNFDNHTDAATVADVNQDDCPDYLQIGVDVGLGVAYGQCDDTSSEIQFPLKKISELGSHMDWTQLSSFTGTGVQCLKFNNSKDCYLVIRHLYGKPQIGEFELVITNSF